MKTTLQEYRSWIKPVWCPGCGDYGVLNCTARALMELGIPPHDIIAVSGIGCSGRLSHYLNAYSLHGTHGRALPTALGAKTARPELTVVVAGGDGDGLGIGGGHIPHAARKNVDLTYLMMDNHIYGLTKGQASPTTPPGRKTKTSPYGLYDDTLDALPMFLAYSVSFVARGTSGNMGELAGLIKAAIMHRGMSMVYVLSPCFTFPVIDYKGLETTLAPLPESHDPTDKLAALTLAYSTEPVYTGIFYQVRRPTLDERIEEEARRARSDMGGGLAGMEDLFAEFA
jgi:2-oxoglutarate ferredoxin oxidoreductase subunit beta